jgi:N-acetylmuramoyl-L-alanine amidase
MTRTDENGLYDETAASKKQSDMQKRKEIIESAAPALVVSVHQNFFPDSSVSGAQVFYAPSSVESERIAATIQGVLCDKLGSDRVHKSADYYVLQCSPYPSVLIECAFMSNEKEDKLLSSSAFREKVALAVADGIDAALTQIEPESV